MPWLLCKHSDAFTRVSNASRVPGRGQARILLAPLTAAQPGEDNAKEEESESEKGESNEEKNSRTAMARHLGWITIF